jgi:hypothetical protein
MFERGIDQVKIYPFEENFVRSAALTLFRESYGAFIGVPGVFEKTIDKIFFSDR